MPLTDIEVISSENGKPVIKVNGKLKRFFDEKAIKQASISLSHEKEYGIACVVLENLIGQLNHHGYTSP